MNRKKKRTFVGSIARKLITLTEPKSVISEQFRTVRTNINFSMPDDDLKSLVITSSVPGEGKSTVSSNIAVVFAQSGKRVLLVDADLRKPTAHHTFGVTNGYGLSNILTRKATLQEVVKETRVDGLHLITSGPIPPNPAELLASKSMEQLIKDVTEMYDLVVFDAPPALAVTDAQILSNKVDGTILVVYSNVAEKENVVKAKELLVASKANILGVVLNKCEMERDHYYYQYYGEAD